MKLFQTYKVMISLGVKKNIYSIIVILSLLAILAISYIFKTGRINTVHASVNANGRRFFFGSNIHPNKLSSTELSAVVTSAQQANFTMLRGGDTFARIAPTSDVSLWNWAVEDDFVNTTTSKGITPMMSLSYGAPWLAADPLNSAETLQNKNDFIKAFGDYSYEVANRYKPGNANGLPTVTYFNVWNEPSLPQFFNWGTDEFARLFAESSYRIKQANPNAVVSFDVHAIDYMYSYKYSPENQTGTTFMPRVTSKTVTLQYNGQTVQVVDYVDMYTTHSYPDRTSNIPENLLGKEISTPFTDFNNYLTHTYQGVAGQRYGYGPVRGAKRFLVGENGWFACPTNTINGHYVSEPKQAALIVRTLLNLISNPLIEGYLQYDMRDDGTGTGCINTNGESENFYGLVRYNFIGGKADPKPSYNAYKLAIETLDGTNIVGKQITTIDTSRKIFNYQFASTDGSKTVWALVRANSAAPLGNLDPTVSQVTLTVTTPTVTMIYLDGTSQVLTASNNSVQVAVSENPVFVVQQTNVLPTNTPTLVPPTATPSPTVSLPTLTPTPTPMNSSIVANIYAPANGTIYNSGVSINIKTSASYNGGTVNNIQISFDGVVKKTCAYTTSSCDYSILSTGLSLGQHTISVVATKTGVSGSGNDSITIVRQ